MFDEGDVSSVRRTMINQDFIVPPGTNIKTGPDTPPLTTAQTGELGKPHEDAPQSILPAVAGSLRIPAMFWYHATLRPR
jgi:hypothetical protein